MAHSLRPCPRSHTERTPSDPAGAPVESGRPVKLGRRRPPVEWLRGSSATAEGTGRGGTSSVSQLQGGKPGAGTILHLAFPLP